MAALINCARRPCIAALGIAAVCGAVRAVVINCELNTSCSRQRVAWGAPDALPRYNLLLLTPSLCWSDIYLLIMILSLRDQRVFSIPGILARISFIFSRSTMRFHFVILVPFSKHEILKEKIPFSSRTPRFIRQKSRLVSKLEIWKKIFSISSRTTRFRETKILISFQKIHISPCILGIGSNILTHSIHFGT